jgi:general secretion pathway protein F
MTTFEYKGYDTDGRPARGLLEADGPKDARARLAARGILTDWLRPAAARATAARRTGRATAFPVAVRTLLYRELAALLDAGVALVPALEIILEAPELGPSRVILAAVRDAVREGRPLSAALSDASPRVTPFERAITEAGERTGGMGRALDRLAGFLEEQERLAEKLRSALAYPCIVVALALLLGTGVLLFLLPAMQRVLSEADLPIPLVTRILLGGGRAAGLLLALLLTAAIAAVLAARRRWRTDPAYRIRLDRRLCSLPAAGPAWRELASLRFVRTWSLLLARGVGLVDALPLAGRASGSPWMADAATREASALAQGKPLVEAIRAIRPLDPSLPSWVRAGETSGNLPGLLDTAATRLQRSWERRTSRAMMLLEIALTLAVGLFVAVIALAILLPVLQMNQGLAPM